ncbi:MAG: aminotransferase class I/II-fold pyridoxal phosphate-dependent enzyme, partial [Acidimicrobiales bacterium]
VADALVVSHGDGYQWRDVVLTNGAAAALTVALHALGQPGDEVVVPVPCWLDHPLYVEASGKSAVLVPLDPGAGFDLDLDALGQALTSRTSAVVVSNPGNPTGRSYGEATIARFARLLKDAEQERGGPITVVADETHRDLAGKGFTPISGYYDRTLIVYSFGKYHALQGQRLGYVALSPQHPDRSTLAAELVRWTRVAGNTSPTSLMQLALPGLLGLRHDPVALDEWRARYVSALASAGFEVVPPDGTHFVYVRTPQGFSDEEWADTLVRHHRVLVVPASLFHHTGYFRLALTATPDGLEAALTALTEAGERWC